MIHTIENDYLRVSVDDHGAELCSIFDKVRNREVIWQADPATGNATHRFFSLMWDVILRITIVLMESNIPPVSMGLPGTANLPAWI